MALEDGSHSKQEEMELRRKKRIKYLIYIVLFIIFQTGIITLFSLTIMKFRTPKITIRSAGIQDFTTWTTTRTTTNPSFNMTLNTELSVKNTNFGSFKYQDSVINFSYNGIQVGYGFFSSSKVGWRATKKVFVAAALMYDGFPANPELGNDLNSGVLMFRSQAQLNGKVRLFSFLFKKKKVVYMDCMLTIGVPDKVVRSSDPLAPAHGYTRSDMEGVDQDAKELRNKKRIKYFLYFIAFCIFQTGVIVLMTFTIMKIRTPKFIMRSASIDSFSVGKDQANPSFSLTMNVQFGVKNTNFGTFKYQDTTVFLYYRGSQVGQVSVPKATALWRSTKKINVFVSVNSSNLPANNITLLSSDLRSGVLPITAQSNLNGKVKLVQMFKKKKAIKLNCSLDVNTSRQVNNIACIT